MARTEDTNAVRRGGEAGEKAMREKAQMLDSRMTAAIAAATAVVTIDTDSARKVSKSAMPFDVICAASDPMNA